LRGQGIGRGEQEEAVVGIYLLTIVVITSIIAELEEQSPEVGQ
jgi:hypothetical protein